MLFQWAKEPLSHYQLGSYDYTKISFNSNTMKFWGEVLKEDTELKGDVHPIQCLINAWEWVRWTQLMHLKLRKLLCLDELTIRLVATIRWASILYRVWFQNKEWKKRCSNRVIHWKGGPINPTLFDQLHGVGMNRPMERHLELQKFSMPISERQNGWCDYPLDIICHGFSLELAL